MTLSGTGRAAARAAIHAPAGSCNLLRLVGGACRLCAREKKALPRSAPRTPAFGLPCLTLAAHPPLQHHRRLNLRRAPSPERDRAIFKKQQFAAAQACRQGAYCHCCLARCVSGCCIRTGETTGRCEWLGTNSHRVCWPAALFDDNAPTLPSETCHNNEWKDKKPSARRPPVVLHRAAH